MNLNLSVVQRELRSGLRDYLADAWAPDRLRAAADTGRFDPKPWRELAGLGLFGLLLPEEDGGMGLGWADAVILFEELGRHLVHQAHRECRLADAAYAQHAHHPAALLHHPLA